MQDYLDIFSDGRILNPDSQGQRCVYIPAGDPCRETYRLSTFKYFPPQVRINPCRFAACGFYYTGFDDRVKCFSCDQIIDSWLPGDDVMLRTWHESDCAFVNGRELRNVPIIPGFSVFSSSEQTSGLPSSSNRSLSDPSTTHSTARHVPMTLTPPPSVAASARARENQPTVSNPPVDRSAIQQHRRFFLFSCLNPINPHMRSRGARLQTFLDHSTTWPSHRIRATPQDIADAGMYYLGERDRAKCWYCNGGLQNWDRDDNPWEEHAKWFPMCEFVLQQKGPEFVHQIVARYPNLRRPTLQNPANVSIGGGNFGRASGSSGRQQGPEVIDPQDELRRRNQKIDEDMTSEVVSHAQMMGFEDDIIKEALKRNYNQHNEGFTTVSELVDALQEIEASGGGEGVTSATASNETSGPGPPEYEEMRRLEETKLCKICRTEASCMVFLPCGHLVCCANCEKKVKNCPTCNEFIRQRVRSFLS